MPLSSESESELAHDLIFRTTDLTRWGVGKGSRLTKEEVDRNFWDVLQLALAAISNPLQPANIQTISVLGDQMTIELTNGNTFGPFTLPVAGFTWTGAFQSFHDYFKNDILTFADALYLVLQDNTTAGTFDPNASNIGGPFYQLMVTFPTRYDVGFFFPDTPGNGISTGAAMFAHRAAHDFFLLADLPGSVCGVNIEPTDDLVCTIMKNTTPIGTLTILADELDASFDFTDDVQFNVGDVLRVIRPDVLDATARELTVTFAGTKGLLP